MPNNAAPPFTPETLDAIAREISSMKMGASDAVISTSEREDASVPSVRSDHEIRSGIAEFLNGSLITGRRVGDMPPSPPTVRARAGAVLVRIVRRALFWYSDQINGVLEWHRNKTGALFERFASNLQEDRVAVRDQFIRVKQDHREIRDQTALVQAKQRDFREELNRVFTDLNVLIQDHAAAQRRDAELRQKLNRAIAVLEQDHAVAERREAELREKLAEQQRASEYLSAQVSSLDQAVSVIQTVFDAEKVPHLQEAVRKLEALTLQTRAMLQGQQSRISLLMSRRTPASDSAAESVAGGAEDGCAELGPLYAAFEDAFRGSRRDIKERLSEHLPALLERGVGGQHSPILDLGSGRGEWLEILAENGLTAEGVDSNATFAGECRERGLQVHTADALAFLRQLPEQSRGAVTAFHVVEHLPFATLLDLLDEAVRVLKPGGVLILETPNPANLIVGAHTFYLDPTHIRPLPADLLRFFVESRGFRAVEVRPLHPFPESFRIQENTRSAAILNDLVYGARDYAVIGERP